MNNNNHNSNNSNLIDLIKCHFGQQEQKQD